MSSQANTKAIIGGILGVLALGAVAVWFDQSRFGAAVVADAGGVATPTGETTPVENAAAADVADTDASAAAETPDVADPNDTGAAEIAAADATPAPDTAADVTGPTFDTFFRNPDETTIIAGRATPGQTVAILLGGVEIDRTVAAADGTFGTIVFIAAADQPRRLTLLSDPDGVALASAETIIVPPSAPLVVAEVGVPDSAAEPESVVAAAETPAVEADANDTLSDAPNGAAQTVATDTAAVDTPAIGTSETGIPETGTPATGTTAPDTSGPTIALGGQPTAPVIPDDSVSVSAPTLIADADGVRVIQAAPTAPQAPAFTDNIALDTITYDPAGEVILAGRAVAGGFVQIYLNNQPVMTSRISDSGNWQIDLPDVDTGVYTLRVDEIDAAGNVQSRVETPFKREEAADVAAILAEETSADGFDIAVKTVQPGSTLWAIAEEAFGEGILYVNVFEANRDLIRDPDLIYPGQVFRLPDLPE